MIFKGFESTAQEEESVMAAQKKIAKTDITQSKPSAGHWEICICAPTTHAGSFKCHLHRTSAPHKSPCPKDITNKSCRNYDSKTISGQPRLSRLGRAIFTERKAKTVASIYQALDVDEN